MKKQLLLSSLLLTGCATMNTPEPAYSDSENLRSITDDIYANVMNFEPVNGLYCRNKTFSFSAALTLWGGMLADVRNYPVEEQKKAFSTISPFVLKYDGVLQDHPELAGIRFDDVCVTQINGVPSTLYLFKENNKLSYRFE